MYDENVIHDMEERDGGDEITTVTRFMQFAFVARMSRENDFEPRNPAGPSARQS